MILTTTNNIENFIIVDYKVRCKHSSKMEKLAAKADLERKHLDFDLIEDVS